MVDNPFRLLNLLVLFCIGAFSRTDTVECLSWLANKHIELRASPLIGGPAWLPLHCKVVVDNGAFVFDYVPRNPTSVETLYKLIMLQSVPAEARIRASQRSMSPFAAEPVGNIDEDSKSKHYVHQAIQFCRNYDKDLHLLNNNCWSFSFDLIRHILAADDDQS